MNSRWQTWQSRPRWDRFVHAVAALTFCLAVAGFAKLSYEVSRGEHLNFENQIMHAMRRDGLPLGPHWMASTIRDITSLGSAAVLIAFTIIILGFLWLSGRHRVAGIIAVSITGGEIMNTVLKNAFDRARPDATLHLVGVHSSSFPSGHAMAASIFYLTMGVLLARTVARRREKIYLVGVAVLFTFLVAFSRVYLGVHYPSDVLAGWAAGTAWALLCWFVADWIARRGALQAETGEPPATDSGRG